MKYVRTFSLAVALVAVGLVVGSDVMSGPKVGGQMIPFQPVNIFNADDAQCNGKENCLVCQYGDKPVAMIFTRSACDCPATLSLIKKLDAQVAKIGKDKMSAAVIYLSDDATLKNKISEFAKTQNITNVSLAQFNAKGPKGYNISPEAGVTVILYKDKKVLANHAADQICEKCVEKVVADLPKLAGN